MIKPENEWHGMTEGDMLDELVEKDVHQFNVDPKMAREAFLGFTPDEIRHIYYKEIGRFNK